MRMGGTTVYDRAKKTGFMLGGQHKMGPAFDDQPEATMNADDPASPDDGDEEGEPGDPPNLRDSSDRPNSCADCKNFTPGGDSGGTCAKYGDASVTPNEVCDGFEGKTEEGDESDGGEGEMRPFGSD